MYDAHIYEDGVQNMATAKGSFTINSWEEDVYEQLDTGGKLTVASVTQAITGDIEGDSSVRWLMAYAPDDTARVIGIQRITGRIGERSGSFVLETLGQFDGEVASGDWTILPGSGSGALAGISGTGSTSAPSGSEATYELTYELG